MKQDSTFMAIVLDRSGSMSSLRDDAIGGFNTFLAEQKKVPGEARLTLAQFDDVYEIVHDGKLLADVPPLTTETYVPRGGTAYFDALGRTIDAVGAKLAAMPEAERPARVIVVIVTDGYENASREYTAERVKNMIEMQRTTYSWEFVFICSDEQALAQAQVVLGIRRTALHAASSAGTQQTYQHMSKNMTSYRGGKGYN